MKTILALLLSFNAFSSTKVIYGVDDRTDFYNTQNEAHKTLSLSTAGMIAHSKLKASGNIIQILSSNLQSRGICKDERFSQQLSAASCSGFLVGEDLLVTAGHCITKQSDCDENAWVFDYKLKFKGDKANTVSKNDVYKCSEIIERAQSMFSKDDYALIRLNRKVTDRAPLKFRKEGQIQEGANLLVIGHPSGLPQKIADGSKVRSLSRKYFKADLDTYGGNSGSAVFNTDTMEVEGILVRGDTDYVRSDKGCRVSNIVTQTAGRGEDVTYITNIKALK